MYVLVVFNLYIVSLSIIYTITNWRDRRDRDRMSLTNFSTLCWYQVHLAWSGFELTTLVVIGTDCIGNYKSNFNTITITTVPSISYSFPLFSFDHYLVLTFDIQILITPLLYSSLSSVNNRIYHNSIINSNKI
jgi:hypothetical protein